ncbi:MAG: hypothetical protein R3D34_18045 [Nitratireductor sp.]
MNTERTTVEARQGRSSGAVRRVLSISLLLAVVAGLVLFLVF